MTRPPAPYVWKNASPNAVSPLIYETHVGMAQEKDGHQLDGVVACVRDARQRQLLEFTERADGVLFLRHADMRFVDERRNGAGGGVFPDVWRGRIPYLRVEGDAVLAQAALMADDARGGGRKAEAFAAVPLDEQAVAVEMVEHVAVEDAFPDAVADWLETAVVVAGPIIESPCQPDICGVWQPFAEDPAAGEAMEPEDFMPVRRICAQFLLLLLEGGKAFLEKRLVWFQPVVI